MSDFKTVTLNQKPLDPYKRVNYTLGLVLGVDEFTQEQTYFIEKNRLHNRALHGYGTICGLDVSVRNTNEGPEVVVSSGLAVNPKGQEIRVPSAQCAKLNSWLARYKDEVAKHLGSPLGTLSLYVVLCYRECETDMVPIPGGPCRSQEDSMAASRIADDFELALRLNPPAQVEEEAVRRFGEFLGRIEVTDEPGRFLTQEEMENLVRSLAAELGSPPASPPPDIGSPPGADLRLRPDEACQILRAAFRVWVTEVRPALLGDGRNCASGPPDESCVLLARLDFNVSQVDDNLQVVGSTSDVTINEDSRSILLHTRLLQEWLLCGRLGRTAGVGTARTFVTLFVQDAMTIRAWIHHPELLDVPAEAVTIEIDDAPIGSPPQLAAVTQPVAGINVFDLELNTPLSDSNRVIVGFDASIIIEATNPTRTLLTALEELDYAYLDRYGDTLVAYLTVDLPALDDLSDVNAPSPADGQVLAWNQQANQWEPQTRAGSGASDHGALTGLEDDDHLQYLPTNGTRALTGTLSAGDNKITNLADAEADGDAMPFGQLAGGDLRDSYPDPIVRRLQGRDVANSDPGNGQVLTWSQENTRWEPQTPQTADGKFVLAPAGPYAIVAAGYFNIEGKPLGSVYNELTVRQLQGGAYNLSFKGYKKPSENFMYIVKGTIAAGKSAAFFQFVEFFNEHLRIGIGPFEALEQIQGFMVEISAFGEI